MAKAKKVKAADDELENTQDESAAEESRSSKKATGGVYKVVSEFRDTDNFNKVHHKGTDVSHFDAARLGKLVELGYVEKQ